MEPTPGMLHPIEPLFCGGVPSAFFVFCESSDPPRTRIARGRYTQVLVPGVLITFLSFFVFLTDSGSADALGYGAPSYLLPPSSFPRPTLLAS